MGKDLEQLRYVTGQGEMHPVCTEGRMIYSLLVCELRKGKVGSADLKRAAGYFRGLCKEGWSMYHEAMIFNMLNAHWAQGITDRFIGPNGEFVDEDGIIKLVGDKDPKMVKSADRVAMAIFYS